MRSLTKDERLTAEQIEALISAQPFKGNIEEDESDENKQFAEDVKQSHIEQLKEAESEKYNYEMGGAKKIRNKPTNITPKKKKRKKRSNPKDK